MSARKNGNVEPSPEAEQYSGEKLVEGDVVGLSPAALRTDRLRKMTPRILHKIGHPNEFIVLDTFENESDGACVVLWPCCFRFVNRKTGRELCQGHSVDYFEKLGSLRTPKKGDKSSSLVLPFLGEVLGFDFQEDEATPKLNANVFGMKGEASGTWAKLIKKLAEDANIL
jgi:hypothetical protein